MNEFHRNRRSRPILAAVLVVSGIGAACNSRTSAGDQLAGSWANDRTQLTANSVSAVYVAACIRAEFLPVALDANRDFSVQSSAITISGNIQITAETRLEMKGHFIGDSLQLQTRLVNLASGVNDPVVFVLPPGALQSVPVCTA